MNELIGPTVCVVCWHDGHPDGPCQEIDGDEVAWFVCGCTDYVTKETRGRIMVDLAAVVLR